MQQNQVFLFHVAFHLCNTTCFRFIQLY